MTRDDLHMDDDFNKDTVSRFDKNTYDLGNVYLNINAKGYMNMNAGDTYELDVFRNWQAIEGFMNAKIAPAGCPLRGGGLRRQAPRRGEHRSQC